MESKTLEEQIKIKNEYMQLALDLMYDYDGFYDKKLKKGNIEDLIGLIDDVSKLLKYAITNDASKVIYGGMFENDKKFNILFEELEV